MKSFLLALSLVINAGVITAQTTFNSTSTGKWSDPLSWDQKRTPGANDIIVINTGHTITVDHHVVLANITVSVMGTLEIGSKKKLELNSGSFINILSGGWLVSEDNHAESMIVLGNTIKYRGNKMFNTNWGIGTVKGTAYATSSSGDLDYSGQGFIFGKLPAVWQDFNLIRASDNQVQMVWVTSHETGSLTFDIERSFNATDWMRIGSIRSIGNISIPQNIYSFVDNKPGSGMIYYRVKHNYQDGRVVYSAVRQMKIEQKQAGFTVYPNPAEGKTNVMLEKTSVEGTNLKIYNTGGQFVKNLSVPKGIQFFPVDLTGLSSGMYLLQMSTPGGDQQIMRLVKH